MIKKKARKQKENAHAILLKRKLYETSTFVKARTKIKKWGAREYFASKVVNISVWVNAEKSL